MDVELQSIVHTLREHSKNNFEGPQECVRLLSILNYNLTEEQLNSSVIDLYMIHIFHASDGILKFVLEVLPNSKFDNASVIALEIVFALINNFPINIKEYITDINDDILKMLNSKGSAKVKAKALDVLILSFEKVDAPLEAKDIESYSAVFRSLNASLVRGIHPDSVRQKEFIAVGVFAKMFGFLVNDPHLVISYYIIQLNEQMVKGPSQVILCGIFTGLNNFCHSGILSLERPEDIDFINQLYKHIKTLSTTNDHRRFGNRAAIEYFGNNMHLFKNSIIKEYKQWHKRLLEGWLNKQGDYKKAGEIALQSLLNILGSTMEQMAKTECLPIIKHFIGWFKSVMRKPEATYTERKLCVQGLKYFSSSLYKHDIKEDAKEMFAIILQHFEKMYIFGGEIDSEESEFLAYYIQCLASFMRFQGFSNSELYYLQKAAVIMIKTFNNLKPMQHHIVIDALVTTLFYLKESKHFNSFLENVIYQGVVWSCSHQHIANVDLEEERGNIVTVKDFFPFWQNLLKLDRSNKFNKYEIFLDDRKYILTKVVDRLVKTLIILINKLNVNLKLNEDVVQSDIEMAYHVENLNDFNIFLNVTDFYQEIFDKIPPDMFEHCICRIVNHMVTKCLKYPFVSGFYKLLSLSLKIANLLKLFETDNECSDQDVINCKETLLKFLIYILHKMKQFKDELLISCLCVLLECPVSIVEKLIAECTVIFITVFELGRSYIALANMGLSALERWQKSMDKVELEKLLLQVIPYLDSYLRSTSLGGLSQENTMEKRRKTARILKKRTVLFETEPELVEFQKRVLRFVGKQNIKVCQAFVSPDNNFETKVTSGKLHLKVTLPYNDCALDIYVEPFILRVIEISLNSSDRKNRVMACELLQAFIVVFLGRAKVLPPSSQSDLDELLSSIATPLLKLACDMDQVVRQIFEPLLMQIIHWYTSKVQRESPHLAVLIEVLMNGVTHLTNASLRDFSGKCINEFVKWTIKQYSASDLKNNPLNITVLVKRMRYFSTHPDLVKKFGAALIFNNIYKEIREEIALISIFAIEVLHIFVSSLDVLEDSNEEVENTVLQVMNALRHLKRIFLQKPDVFRKCDPSRRVPYDINKGDLTGVSMWLLAMTSSRSKYCRDICMELFIHLQPLCVPQTSLSVFIQNNATDLVPQYMRHLQNHLTLEDVATSDDPTTILLKWLQGLLCLIDGYIFIVSNSMCFVNIDEKANITSILYFLKHFQRVTVVEALNLISNNSQQLYYTVGNKEEFLNLKASCCLAILKLANAILSDETVCKQSSGFWNPYFWNLICNAIFTPSSLGFDAKLSQLQYLDVLALLLNSIPRKLKGELTVELVDIVRQFVADNFNPDVDLKRVGCMQRNMLKGLLMIQRSQLNHLFKAEEFSVGLIDKLVNCFLKDSEDNEIFIARTSEATAEYCLLVLKFALTDPQEMKTLMSHLYQNTVVNYEELTCVNEQTRLGLYLLQKFPDPIVRVVVDGFDIFLEGVEPTELTVKLMSELLTYLESNKADFKDSFHTISRKMLEKWPIFQLCFEEYGIDAGLDLVRQMYRLFGIYISPSLTIPNWILGLICTEDVLLSENEGVNLYLNLFNVLVEVVTDDDLENLSPALEQLKLRLQLADVANSTVVEKFLATLPAVKSPTIFTFLLELYVNTIPISKNDIDLAKLLKPFMWKNSNSCQRSILNHIYCMGVDTNKTFEIKKKLVDYVIPHILKTCNYRVFETFFAEKIKEITSEIENTCNCGNSLFFFSLLELLFLRIPIGSEERTSCSITDASENPKLRNQLLKIALQAFKNNKIEGTTEQLRILKCGAYKALASIVTNSVKSEIFLEKLFVREENNEDILWSSLIDLNVTYSFPIDFDDYPKKRKVLINIRKALGQDDQNSLKSLKYIESQRLFNSSLSEDVTKFDFTSTVLRTNSTINSRSDDNDVEPHIDQAEIYLENTEINSNELIGTVCGIIGYMFSTGISQLPENPDDMVELPNWMNGIVKLLLNPNTHGNIKIFWVKVIDNMIHIFRHFSQFFVEPLLQFLNDKIAGQALNYFVTDVIVILASWTSLCQPNEKEANLASEFLDHVINSLTNYTQSVFKYNLELVRLIVENWKDFIQVPYNTLKKKMDFDINNRENEVGVHLTSIFLVKNVLPCAIEDINLFWSKLMRLLSSTVSTIYKPCSETLGLMLKYCKVHAIEFQSFIAEVNKILHTFSNDKYAHCLEGVAIHFVDIIDEYHITKILSRLPPCDQILQITFLKLICNAIEIVGEMSCFKDEDWGKYLDSQRVEIQLITLEIIWKSVDILKWAPSFKELIKTISKKVLSPNVLCRAKMYDIMISLSQIDIEGSDISELCKEVLIQGLVDPDMQTRENMRKFWSENPSIPSDISYKFPHLLSNLYLAKAEEHFLGYTSYFLLDSINSEEYEKELFEIPLENCDFQEYKLQTNWRLQHPSMVPLFAETLRTYTEDLNDINEEDFEGLRATQDNLTFAPTLLTAREQRISQVTSLESSLIGKSQIKPSFINPNDVQLSEKYKLPKKRFLKDRAKISTNFANIAISQRNEKTQERRDAVKERANKVTIYRSYRKGDFPDIQIKLGFLLKPLQMLVLNDSELSKIFISVLYKSLKEKANSRNDAFNDMIKNGITNIFSKSVQFNTNVISSLLDILLQSQREFLVDPALISTVCQQSGLMSIGALLIEEYLINYESFSIEPKRGIGNESGETRHWLKLAELYKELHEWDLVKCIFLEKTNCKENVAKAIALESENKWHRAEDEYEKLITTDLSSENQDFYFESLFKCLANLGKWEMIPKAVDSLVADGGENTWSCLWDNDWLQQKILPWYVSAQVKNGIFSSADCTEQFLLNLNKSLRDPDQSLHLKQKFSTELCVLWLMQNGFSQAMQFLKNGLDAFLSEWQLLNPMFGNLRYNKILSLQTLIELDQFLHFEKTLTDCPNAVNSLQDYWKSTPPDFFPSIVLNEGTLLYRKLFIKLLVDRLQSTNQLLLIKELKRTDIGLDLRFMSLAAEEGNFYMTRKYFKQYVKMNHPKLTMIQGSLNWMHAKLQTNESDTRIQQLLKAAVAKFKEVIDSRSVKDVDVITSFVKIIDINMDLSTTRESSDFEDACEGLKTKLLQDTTKHLGSDETTITSNALLKLAYIFQDRPDHDSNFVMCVLRAMKLGSKEARQLFPCILLKEALESDLAEIFIRETENLPTWMFLGWIPQLLANVDSPKVTAVSSIILRIAQTYPQAIIYSYRLSKDNYCNSCELFVEERKRLIVALDILLLSDTIVDKFLTALSRVSVPSAAVQYYLNKMHTAQDVKLIMQNRDCIFELLNENSSSRDSTCMQGNVYKSLKVFKKDFEKINVHAALEQMTPILKNLIQRASMIKTNSVYLKDYCPWLANFSSGRMSLQLEIPGQYNGEKMPLVQHHIKIAGFCERVSVMNSQRQPIKLTMLGMNGKEYPFLIKFGEDIRLDQRIQQLFMLMNNIFVSGNTNHQLLTYQVVPLSSRVGLIQWVENTESLDAFIERSLSNKSTLTGVGQVVEKNLGNVRDYNAYRKIPKDKLIPLYNYWVNMIPRDVLRKSVWSMSLTTEGFIASKNNFIKSYAVICACHWILGIGDRHLQNSKVCTRTGKVLGIDFGHAFGTATQHLPIPELVPIRLTPHLEGLMEPLKAKGSFRAIMIDCLKLLNINKNPLIATMNVFIQDPSVDWLEHAQCLTADLESSQSSKLAQGTSWYPKQKIKKAARKLQGASSMSIMVQDLKSSVYYSRPNFHEFVEFVEGDQDNLRFRLRSKEILTVEEQVDVLIDHATDTNLLGRMFRGWTSYV